MDNVRSKHVLLTNIKLDEILEILINKWSSCRAVLSKIEQNLFEQNPEDFDQSKFFVGPFSFLDLLVWPLVLISAQLVTTA